MNRREKRRARRRREVYRKRLSDLRLGHYAAYGATHGASSALNEQPLVAGMTLGFSCAVMG